MNIVSFIFSSANEKSGDIWQTTASLMEMGIRFKI